MSKPNVMNWIVKQKLNGCSDDYIKSFLIDKGYDKENLDQAFVKLSKKYPSLNWSDNVFNAASAKSASTSNRERLLVSGKIPLWLNIVILILFVSLFILFIGIIALLFSGSDAAQHNDLNGTVDQQTNPVYIGDGNVIDPFLSITELERRGLFSKYQDRIMMKSFEIESDAEMEEFIRQLYFEEIGFREGQDDAQQYIDQRQQYLDELLQGDINREAQINAPNLDDTSKDSLDPETPDTDITDFETPQLDNDTQVVEIKPELKANQTPSDIPLDIEVVGEDPSYNDSQDISDLVKKKTPPKLEIEEDEECEGDSCNIENESSNGDGNRVVVIPS